MRATPVNQAQLWHSEVKDRLRTLDDVYRKFGEASEAAQLLETELGTLLLWEQAIADDLLGEDGRRYLAH